MAAIQVNLHHSRAASAALCKMMAGHPGIALIQEPWLVRGKITGLGGTGGELIFSRSHENPRACILIKKDIQIMPLTELCSRDVATVKIKLNDDGGPRELVLASVYMPYDSSEPPPSRDVEKLVMYCRESGLQFIAGCDANAHHSIWGSSNTNDRGEYLLEFIMANNLDILNEGNKPTFINIRRQKVIDITLATASVKHRIKWWHVSDEESLSDHRYILFEITRVKPTCLSYWDPHRTN